MQKTVLDRNGPPPKRPGYMVAVPLGSGGLQLELHAGGADVEIEIDPSGKVTAVCWARC